MQTVGLAAGQVDVLVEVVSVVVVSESATVLVTVLVLVVLGCRSACDGK